MKFFFFTAGPSKPIHAGNMNYIPSGCSVTIMDVNDTSEMVYVRNCSPEYTEEFLGNVIKIHVAHLEASTFKLLANVNDMCVTKFKNDDLWYRAKVIKEIQPLTYLVRFVDFGIVEKVHWSLIREYNFEVCSEIPFNYRHPFKLNYISHWNANIKRYLINVSRNFHNIYKIMYNNFGEPVILQPPNNSVTLNEELRNLITIPNQTQIQFKPRECLIPQTEIMTLLQTYNLPGISDCS